MADAGLASRVVVIHRDAGLRARIAAALVARGHTVRTGPVVDRQIHRSAVVVIDHRLLPCPTASRVVALVPTAAEEPILAAFAAGADDVVTTPSRPAELASRVDVIARAASRPATRVGPVIIDTASRRVLLAGRQVELTRREYGLLSHLATAPGRVFTKQELLGALWPETAGSSTRRLDTQVARLRRRLGEHRGLLVTVWGVGYRLGD